MGVFTILTFIKVYENDFARFGINIFAAGAGIIALIFILCLCVGYIEEWMNWWGAESLHIWKLAGYDPIELVRDVKEIKSMMHDQHKCIYIGKEETIQHGRE